MLINVLYFFILEFGATTTRTHHNLIGFNMKKNEKN